MGGGRLGCFGKNKKSVIQNEIIAFDIKQKLQRCDIWWILLFEIKDK